MWKKSTIKVLLFTPLVVLSVGAFNWVIDPFGIRTIDGKFGEFLSGTENFRIHKAKIFSDHSNTIIFGSSRVIRINPKIFKTYNIDARIVPISGNTLDEAIIVSKYAKKNAKI